MTLKKIGHSNSSSKNKRRLEFSTLGGGFPLDEFVSVKRIQAILLVSLNFQRKKVQNISTFM